MSKSDAELLNSLHAEIGQLQLALDKSRNDKRGKATLPSSKEGKDCKSARPFTIRERRLLRGHFGKVYALCWCPNLKTYERVVSASQDGSLIVWNSTTGSKLRVIRLSSQWVMSVAYSPSGQVVASGGLDNQMSGFKYETKGLLEHKSEISFPDFTLQQHQGYISCARFISDEHLLTSSGDGTVVLWDVPKKRVVTVFEGHESDVLCVAPVGSNGTFISGSCDCTARLWDPRTGGCVQIYTGHESDVNAVDRFPDGFAFGTASDDNTCRIFDTRSWGELGSFSDQKLAPATSCTFSSSGRYLFAGYDDHSVRVWDSIKGVMVEPTSGLNTHERRVSCLGLSANGAALCTGSWDDSLKVWA